MSRFGSGSGATDTPVLAVNQSGTVGAWQPESFLRPGVATRASRSSWRRTPTRSLGAWTGSTGLPFPLTRARGDGKVWINPPNVAYWHEDASGAASD